MNTHSKRLPGIFVHPHQTQRTLEELKALNLKLDGIRLIKDRDQVGIPLLRRPAPYEEGRFRKRISDYQIRDALFEPLPSKPKDLSEALRDVIPPSLVADLPRSFDVIGDIAVIDFPPRLALYSQAVARGIIQVSPQVRLVLKKSSEVTGIYRTRELQKLEGSGSTETVHREFNCTYHLDVASVYFNPRLANERRRVAAQATRGEVVVDMFAGVGPFSILLAKLQSGCMVYSVDINPAAEKYLRENIFTNRLADRVIPVLGDAEQLSRDNLRGVADRVIMNLPSTSKQYLPSALRILKTAGGHVHYYEFAPRDTDLSAIRERFANSVMAEARRVEFIRYCEVVREVGPSKIQVVVDADIK